MAGRWGGWLRFGLPGVALGVLLSWGAGFHGEPSSAWAQDATTRPVPGGSGAGRTATGSSTAAKGTTAESGGVMAMVTNPPPTPGVQWLYLVDTRKRSFAVYRVDPTNPQGCVKLEAARQFRWDLDLDEYNNQGLEPADVRARVEAVSRTNP